MANRLTMAKIKAILTLHQHGWSCRRIGRELGIRHETASKYIQAAGASKPATAPPGSDDSEAASGRLPPTQAPASTCLPAPRLAESLRRTSLADEFITKTLIPTLADRFDDRLGRIAAKISEILLSIHW